MSEQNPQSNQAPSVPPVKNPQRSKKTFIILVLAAAVIGIFFIASALLNPHKAGIVTNVGRISKQT